MFITIITLIAALTALLGGGAVAAAPVEAVPVPRVGPGDAAFDALDGGLAALMGEGGIPGGVVAVARRGELAHWQAFGWADREGRIPAGRDTLFRAASLSKPLTAVAVLRLAEAGRLSLDAPLGALLPELARGAADGNIPKITVRQLLGHSGGWDDGEHDEVALRDEVRRLARLAGPGGGVTPADLVRRRFAKPLDFAPGSGHGYSNFGYVVLGRVIEGVCGGEYARAVQNLVLEPAGCAGPAGIGSPWLSGLMPGEARYYDYPGAKPVEAALAPGRATPWPDGGIATTTLDAALGWVACAPCLALFTDRTFAAMHGRAGLLGGETVAVMLARPAPLLAGEGEAWYGLGWRVKPLAGGKYAWHGGSMPGTTALAAHHPSDISVAVLMNSRPRQGAEFSRRLQDCVEQALNAIAGT